jgi:tryptophan-rich sensory protein
LRYTASSTSKREPDGFSSFVYLLHLLLASLWSSVCFRLPTLAVGFPSSCCRCFRVQS